MLITLGFRTWRKRFGNIAGLTASQDLAVELGEFGHDANISKRAKLQQRVQAWLGAA